MPQTPKTLLTIPEIVEDYLANMTKEQKAEWRAFERDQLSALHFGTGTYIRNHYKLWEMDDEVYTGRHPDDVSTEIIERVWERLRAEGAE